MFKAIIFCPPVTKKNSSVIARNGNRTFILPSKQYREYEKHAAMKVLQKCTLPISSPVCVCACYYMQTKRRVDKTNLESALLDFLVTRGVLEDDNCNIVIHTDGSRVYYDKVNPRTEIYIYPTEKTF